MPFLELSVHCRESEQPRYEHALEDVGALAVTLLDADASTPDERAILEPGVGETPLWSEVALSALFPHDADALLLLAALESFDPGIDWTRARFRNVEDQDWERAWMDQYQPLRFGARTWIVPWNRELPGDAQAGDAAVVRLDPGLAFGSGTHPTTSLCLQWLDALAAGGALRDAHVLDFGCGSGILALAALKLGAAGATGVDNDPQALLATRDNADRNGVSARLDVFEPAEAPARTYPVVVANILASALDSLADTLAARVAPGGRIALSGILAGQEPPLLARYGAWFADRATLAADARWRPAVVGACMVLRCEVPAWREPEALVLVRRDVRPLPGHPGVLHVSAEFRNDAVWPQAWPMLVLTLADVDGRTVGSRAFQPGEYLGKAPTHSTLDSGQSARIEMDLVEPAPGVVAFTFDFR